VAQVCRRHRLDPVNGVEQTADFLVRQHACQERLRFLGAAALIWHVGGKAESAHE